MNDQIKAEQPNKAHISPSVLNAGLGDESMIEEVAYYPYYPMELPSKEVMEEFSRELKPEVPNEFWPDGIGLRIIRHEIESAMSKGCAACAQCRKEPRQFRSALSWLVDLKRRLF